MGHSSVAGVQAPAFVERGRSAMRSSPTRQVSPGFRPRPSLSVAVLADLVLRDLVSPGFRPRPSLSDARPAHNPRPRGCVAGVQAPAFVERG